MSKELSAFTKKLRLLMQEKNISVEDLAQQAALSEKESYDLYSGFNYQPMQAIVSKLALTLGPALKD